MKLLANIRLLSLFHAFFQIVPSGEHLPVAWGKFYDILAAVYKFWLHFHPGDTTPPTVQELAQLMNEADAAAQAARDEVPVPPAPPVSSIAPGGPVAQPEQTGARSEIIKA